MFGEEREELVDNYMIDSIWLSKDCRWVKDGVGGEGRREMKQTMSSLHYPYHITFLTLRKGIH